MIDHTFYQVDRSGHTAIYEIRFINYMKTRKSKTNCVREAKYVYKSCFVIGSENNYCGSMIIFASIPHFIYGLISILSRVSSGPLRGGGGSNPPLSTRLRPCLWLKPCLLVTSTKSIIIIMYKQFLFLRA